MMISELISNLEQMLEVNGDMEVLMQDIDNEFASPVGAGVMSFDCGHRHLVLATKLQLNEIRKVVPERNHHDLNEESH